MCYTIKCFAREKQGYAYMKEIVPYEDYFANDQYDSAASKVCPILTKHYAKIFRDVEHARQFWIENELELKKDYDIMKWEVMDIVSR